MEERPAETKASVDSSATPSVAQLAGRFREQAAAVKETPASKPTRRKPPCSLPLFPPRVELGQNGEQLSANNLGKAEEDGPSVWAPVTQPPPIVEEPEVKTLPPADKSPPNASHPPKVKVKSSPLIEKLQANLTFDPAALLPGASPKSPGFKAMVSPFHSPPSTPSSPGVRSRGSEAEEVPVSFDQPPEGSHLPCYNKVRTRGSIKRRPPSRRFRRSQSDCGDLGDLRVTDAAQENGTKEENGDEVFLSKSRAPGSLPASEGVAREGVGGPLGPGDRPPLRRTRSGPEKQEEQDNGAVAEAPQCEKAEQNSGAAAPAPPQASSPEAENGQGSPMEAKPAEEEMEGKGEKPGAAEPKPGLKDEKPEEAAAGVEVPQGTPGGMEDSDTPKLDKGQEKQEEGAVPEPGCSPGTSHALQETSSQVHSDGPTVPNKEDDSLGQDTKM